MNQEHEPGAPDRTEATQDTASTPNTAGKPAAKPARKAAAAKSPAGRTKATKAAAPKAVTDAEPAKAARKSAKPAAKTAAKTTGKGKTPAPTQASPSEADAPAANAAATVPTPEAAGSAPQDAQAALPDSEPALPPLNAPARGTKQSGKTKAAASRARTSSKKAPVAEPAALPAAPAADDPGSVPEPPAKAAKAKRPARIAPRQIGRAKTPPRSIAEADAMLAEERAARKALKTNPPLSEEETPPSSGEAQPARPAGTAASQRGKAPSQRAAAATEPAMPLEQEPTPGHEKSPEKQAVTAEPPAPRQQPAGESPDAAGEMDEAPAEVPAEPSLEQEAEGGQEQKPRRRSRRGGRRRSKNTAAQAAKGSEETTDAPPEQPEQSPAETPLDHEEAGLNDTAPSRAEPIPADALANASPAETPADAQAGKANKAGSATAAGPEAAAKGKNAKAGRRMFISVLSGELVELVLTDNGSVQEYYVEMTHQAKIKGNIYKGVVSNVDANLQAAFVSYGGAKNGFLQIDEVHPEYYQAPHDGSRKFPPIQKVLKQGQELLVQVVKEPAGTKGAFLTTYLSLPGRFLVLTPGREQIGVSRKVDDGEERNRLRELLSGLNPGAGLGVIVRTVSIGASKTSLQRDLQFLKRLWKDVRGKGTTIPAPGLIYQELDLAARAIRDYLTDEVREVWVDDAGTAETIQETITLLFPKKKDLVHIHTDPDQTLFERFNLQKQLDQISSRETVLPSGGRLVFDYTEALTAIDINSSRSSGKNNFEDMAYRTNLEAAKMIPLQLRLRDIGGQVVVDFIEMRDREHWREVEKAVRAGMKGDRARYDVGKIGPFGMLEIVRQRLGSSAISVSTEPCPICKGTGFRRNLEWQSLRALRGIHKLMRQAQSQSKNAVTYQAEPELAFYLLNTKRETLQELEKQYGVRLSIAMGTENGHA